MISIQLNALLNKDLTTDISQPYGKRLRQKYPSLHNFQINSIIKATQRPAHNLFFEMGLGKTFSALIIAKELNLPAIVLTKESIMNQWQSEIEKWDLNLTCQLINGNKNKRLIQYSNLKQVNVICYESFRNDVSKLIFSHPFIFILDEASKCKNAKTTISKIVKKIRKQPSCKFVTCLTGTPLENKLEDIYNIIDISHPGFITWSEFRKDYCVMKELSIWRNGKLRKIMIVEHYKNLDMFHNKIKEICSISRKDDPEIRDLLPEKTVNYRFIKNSVQQREVSVQLINNAKDDGRAFIEIYTLLHVCDSSINALAQSESNLIWPIVEESKNPKIEEVKDILNEIGNKQIIIFTKYARVASQIYDDVKNNNRVEVVTGSTKNKEEIVKQFKNFEFNILISTDTLAYGMDFVDCDYVINFDLPFNPAILNQRMDRIHRMGSERNKTIINLVGGGIERDVYEILKSKTVLISGAVEGLNIKEENVIQLLKKKYGFER